MVILFMLLSVNKRSTCSNDGLYIHELHQSWDMIGNTNINENYLLTRRIEVFVYSSWIASASKPGMPNLVENCSTSALNCLVSSSNLSSANKSKKSTNFGDAA